MTISGLATLLCFCTISLSAFAQLDPRTLGEEDKVARPVLVVPPAFPARDATDKFPVEIKISGTVSEAGIMESPVFSQAEGKEKFIQAIQEVLPLWRFRPAADRVSCSPIKSYRVMSIWFEEKNGVPSVWASTSTAKSSQSPIVDGKTNILPRSFVWRPKVEYPQAAQRAGMEGAVDLLFQVNHQGEVLKVKVLYSTPKQIFADAALEGSKRVTFSSGAVDSNPHEKVCIVAPFLFCLTDVAEYPISACKNRYANKNQP